MSNSDESKAPLLIKRQVKQIVSLLVAISFLVLAVGYFQVQVMSAVRAYVLGESLWAKAQKDAVMQLREYLVAPNEETYQAINKALELNIADRQARLALQQDSPDIEQARQGFLGGGNHPDDIPSMIQLFIWFQNVRYMKNAIEIWVEADKQIEVLLQLSSKIRQSHLDDPSQDLRRYIPQLNQLNNRLNRLETEFSYQLSEGARWMKNILLWVNFSMLLSMVIVVVGIARKVVRDIDQTESKLRISESRFKTLYDSNIIGIFVWGSEGEVLDANDEFLKILGYSRADLRQGKLNWRGITPQDWQSADERGMQKISEQGYCEPFNKEFFHKSGERVPVFVGGALIDGISDKGVAFMVDRSNEKEIERQLLLSATVMEASRDGILICDHERKVLSANESYLRMTGLKEESVIGKVSSFIDGDESETTDEIYDRLKQDGYWQGDNKLQLAHGGNLPVRISISTVCSDSGDLTYYVAVYTDISERKALEYELTTMAHYDHLTGLANRSLYVDRLDTAITRAERNNKHCALLFIDLDKFKPVNDQYGHETGDVLLRQVAVRLLSLSRKSDTVGRLGGDEFVMVIEEWAEADSVISFAEKIAQQLHQPFYIENIKICIGCSIGVAIYPENGSTSQELIRSADSAMYKIKGKQGVRYSVC